MVVISPSDKNEEVVAWAHRCEIRMSLPSVMPVFGDIQRPKTGFATFVIFFCPMCLGKQIYQDRTRKIKKKELIANRKRWHRIRNYMQNIDGEKNKNDISFHILSRRPQKQGPPLLP